MQGLSVTGTGVEEIVGELGGIRVRGLGGDLSDREEVVLIDSRLERWSEVSSRSAFPLTQTTRSPRSANTSSTWVRLGTGGDIAGDDDAVGGGHVGFGEDGLQGREDSVDVGDDRHASQHAAHCARTALV